MGPVDESSTTLNPVYKEFKGAISTLINQLIETNDQGLKIVNENTVMYNAIDTGITQAKGYEQQFNDYENRLFEDLEHKIKVSKWIWYSGEAVFYVFIFLTTLIVMLTFLILDEKTHYIHKYLLKTSWCVFSLAALGLFVLSAIVIPVSIMAVETCEVFNDFITKEEKFDEYIGVFDEPDIHKNSKVCLFGKGNLMEEFGMNEVMNVFIDLGTNIELLSRSDHIIESTTIPVVLDYINTVYAFKQSNNNVEG